MEWKPSKHTFLIRIALPAVLTLGLALASLELLVGDWGVLQRRWPA